MPIEIKELHIRVAVNAAEGAGAASPAGQASASTGNNKEALVAECVEQVMQIVHAKKER